MNKKHITTVGLLIALVIAPAASFAYESYQPLDTTTIYQTETVDSLNARILEIDEMIAALEAERAELVAVREEMQLREDLRNMINDLIAQATSLGGDISHLPDEADRAQLSTDDLQQIINDLLALVASLQAPHTDGKLRDTDGDGWIYGSNGNDYYQGDDKENILVGSPENDYMYGGNDWDEVNYVGPTDCAADFTITHENDGSVTVRSTRYGIDHLRDVEAIYFAGCGDWIRL